MTTKHDRRSSTVAMIASLRAAARSSTFLWSFAAAMLLMDRHASARQADDAAAAMQAGDASPLMPAVRRATPEIVVPSPAGASASSAASSSGKGPSADPRTAIRWPEPRFVYKADGRRLADVLMDFASSQGVPAVIADGVDGVVQASFDTTPDRFLSAVSRAYGIIWYFDGAALYVYPSRAIQSRIFRLRGYAGSEVEALLHSLQLVDRRYPLRYNKLESTLLVYGPPRHVELVSAAIESLDVGAGEGRRATTRVVSLRYAWAADRHFGETTLPGLAVVLQGLYGHAPASPRAAGPANAGVAELNRKSSTLSRTYGLDRGAPQLPPANGGDEASRPPQDRSMTGTGPRGVRSPLDDDDDTPTFQADEATNTVMVRGRKDRMSEYVDVIRQLDTKPTLVELEAMIIDVSNDSVDSLGIDWSASGAHGSVSLTSPTGTPVDSTFGTTTAGVFTLSTLWANAGRQVLARINALESTGKARIVAKPRVLGIANRTAMMSDKRIVNVRVAGNLDTSLYQVEAGTDLQVTPQVMSFDATSRIKLSIYIVDGKFEDAEVDQVPVVKRSEIQTEAYMTEGESLLIGGITSDSDIARRSGVPGLSRIPLIGGLFRQTQTQAAHTERLFLITPRLLRDVPAAALQTPSSQGRLRPPSIDEGAAGPSD